MVSFESLIVLATMASAMVIHDRDVNIIEDNLRNIDASAKKMASDAKAWDGTASGSIIIFNDEQTMDDRDESATSEAKGEPPLSIADSKTVLAYFSQPFMPDFKAGLDVLVSRKNDFQQNDLTDLIENILVDVKAITDALGSALMNVVSSDQKQKARNELATLDGYLNSAIAAFS